MQLEGNYKKIYTLLAIATVFSTVAPVRIYAQDTVIITNFMGTSQNTGGQSTKGQDGQDGQNGQSGQSGQDGQNGQGGQSGQNGQDGTSGQPGKSGADRVDGKSTASVHIESTAGAHQKQVVVDSPSSLSTSSATTGSAVPEIVNSPEQTESALIVESSLSGVQHVLLSLRVMFFKYVSLLF